MDLSQYEINDIENCFNRLGLEFSFEKKKIFSIIIEKPHLVPKIRGKINTIVDYVLKWDTKYVKGYNNRPSKSLIPISMSLVTYISFCCKCSISGCRNFEALTYDLLELSQSIVGRQ